MFINAVISSFGAWQIIQENYKRELKELEHSLSEAQVTRLSKSSVRNAKYDNDTNRKGKIETRDYYSISEFTLKRLLTCISNCNYLY